MNWGCASDQPTMIPPTSLVASANNKGGQVIDTIDTGPVVIIEERRPP